MISIAVTDEVPLVRTPDIIMNSAIDDKLRLRLSCLLLVTQKKKLITNGNA